jgi:microcystin-dependent protein
MTMFLSDDYIGMISLWYGNGNSLPPGWLLCDGDVIDTSYEILIGRIGPNLPDLGGRTVIGAGVPFNKLNTDGSSPNWNLNADGSLPTFTNRVLSGEFNHQLILGEMPKHAHNLSMNDDWQGGGGSDKTLVTAGDGNWATDIQGNSEFHNNAQPSLVVNYMIYAGESKKYESEKDNA